jgi:hypothetical protein
VPIILFFKMRIILVFEFLLVMNCHSIYCWFDDCDIFQIEGRYFLHSFLFVVNCLSYV